MAKPSLDPIYNRLKAASGYHPSSSVAFADWSVESGDIITMAKDGETYSTPVFASTMTWRGTPEMTTETTGKKKREPVAKAAERKYAGGGGYRGARETSEWVKTIEKKTGVNEMGEGGTTLYGQIVNTGDKVGLVVGTKSGKNYIKAGEIALSINETTGQTKAVIDADHVAISGNTTVSGVMEIDGSGYLKIKKSIVVSATATSDVISIGGGTIQAKTFSVPSTGNVTFIGSQGGERYSLNATVLKGMIKTATVNGNVLTLTPFYGEAINFSKATSLRGEWSSGTYTVTATPQGNTISTELADHLIDGSWSNDKKTYTGYAAYVSGESFISTGRQIVVNATAAYTAGWNDVTVTKVALADIFEPITDNSQRWSIYIQGTARNGQYKRSQFYLDQSSTKIDGNYYVNLRQVETNEIIGRIFTTNAYNGGWGDAVAKVKEPADAPSGQERTTFVVKVPSSTVGSDTSMTFTLSKGNPGTSGYASVSYLNKAVGRIDISNWYSGGWRAAATASDYPNTEDTSSTYITVTVPSNTVGSTIKPKYYLAKDNDYIYLRKDSPSPNAGTTVARIANTVSVTGWFRTPFPQNLNHSVKHAFDIPVSVTVNGTEYSHTFTTAEMYLSYKKVGTVDTYELICGSTVIYRFEV